MAMTTTTTTTNLRPSHLDQLSLLPSAGRKWVPAKVRWCSAAGE